MPVCLYVYKCHNILQATTKKKKRFNPQSLTFNTSKPMLSIQTLITKKLVTKCFGLFTQQKNRANFLSRLVTSSSSHIICSERFLLYAQTLIRFSLLTNYLPTTILTLPIRFYFRSFVVHTHTHV